MKNRRPILTALAIVAASCASALAGDGDVTIYERGSGETLSYGVTNASTRVGYAVQVEVVRVDVKTGETISKRITQVTLDPLGHRHLGPKIQQGAELRYRVANTRLKSDSKDRPTTRGSSLPAPFPVTFGGK